MRYPRIRIIPPCLDDTATHVELIYPPIVKPGGVSLIKYIGIELSRKSPKERLNVLIEEAIIEMNKEMANL